ncbi:MAG: hypothetical protein NVS4B8_07430 [Herpetosiphon sp.]
MKRTTALISGAIGAITLNIIHETSRHLIDNPPRIEVIGMRGVAQLFRKAEQPVPSRDTLYWLALAGDLVSNGLYYSLIAGSEDSAIFGRGIGLGLAGGLGAAFLPAPLGLGHQPNAVHPRTELLTVCWYLVGGLVTAAAYRALSRHN